MKLIKLPIPVIFGLCVLVSPVVAAEKPADKKTCCQKAADEGKECRHKCCVAAHKEEKSCEKCNPGKEDLKLKDAKKGPKKG